MPAPRYDSTIAVMSGSTRKGVWELGASHTAFALMAGIDLDLREARFTARETVVYANAIWAGIDIIVNEYTQVIVEGVGIMGAFDQGRDKVAPALTPGLARRPGQGRRADGRRHGDPQADARAAARLPAPPLRRTTARPPRGRTVGVVRVVSP